MTRLNASFAGSRLLDLLSKHAAAGRDNLKAKQIEAYHRTRVPNKATDLERSSPIAHMYECGLPTTAEQVLEHQSCPAANSLPQSLIRAILFDREWRTLDTAAMRVLLHVHFNSD